MQRGQQDLGECVIDAVRHLAASEGRGAGLCLEKRDRHLLVKETAELTARYLADQGKVEPARLSAPLQAPAPLRPPPPPGMVYCRRGHRPHPAGKECPDCVAKRQRAYRANHQDAPEAVPRPARQATNGATPAPSTRLKPGTTPAPDGVKYVLGKLCREGHEYAQTGQSLLYEKSRACFVCNRERKRRTP